MHWPRRRGQSRFCLLSYPADCRRGQLRALPSGKTRSMTGRKLTSFAERAQLVEVLARRFYAHYAYTPLRVEWQEEGGGDATTGRQTRYVIPVTCHKREKLPHGPLHDEIEHDVVRLRTAKFRLLRVGDHVIGAQPAHHGRYCPSQAHLSPWSQRSRSQRAKMKHSSHAAPYHCQVRPG